MNPLNSPATHQPGAGHSEIDPVAEEQFWRENHARQEYADSAKHYENFAGAYRVGYSGFREGATFEEREEELARAYERTATEPPPGSMEYNMSTRPQQNDSEVAPASPERPPGSMEDNMSSQPLAWSEVRPAAKAAYDRIGRMRSSESPSAP